MTDIEQLRRRVLRTFGDKRPEGALKRVRAIVGPGNMPATFEGTLATQALEKLKDPDAERPTPAELAALEMMVRMMRPAPKYEDGKLDDVRNLTDVPAPGGVANVDLGPVERDRRVETDVLVQTGTPASTLLAPPR